MSWNVPLRPAIHEAGHIVVGYVLSNKKRSAAYAGIGIMNRGWGKSWEGTSGTPDLIAPEKHGDDDPSYAMRFAEYYADWLKQSDDEKSREVMRLMLAGIFSGKVAVANAIYRGALKPAPRLRETEPGDYGYKGVSPNDEGVINLLAQRFSDPDALIDEAFSLSIQTVNQHFDCICSMADWVVTRINSGSNLVVKAPIDKWPHPVIDQPEINEWLKNNFQ